MATESVLRSDTIDALEKLAEILGVPVAKFYEEGDAARNSAERDLLVAVRESDEEGMGISWLPC